VSASYWFGKVVERKLLLKKKAYPESVKSLVFTCENSSV